LRYGIITILVIAKVLDPVDLRIEQQDLAKNIDDAGEENDQDYAVDRRVPHKGGDERPAEGRSEYRHQHEEQNHPEQKAARMVHAAKPIRSDGSHAGRVAPP